MPLRGAEKPMHEFTVEKIVDAPVAGMWRVVADFANLDWFPGAERSEAVGGPGVGQVRRIYMPGMDAPVEEKLLALDPESHTLEYAVLEGPVNVLRDYRVVASLQEAGPDKTRAIWQAAFSGVAVDGVSPEDMTQVMRDTYDGMLDAMAAAARG
ncbi:MAG: hypothetical protein CME40_14410 [Haliea sp.]|nr:hypothetical protein [Haliea sp.]